MRSSDIRRRFLDYFAQQQHVVRPSSSLVPADDPTLLFVNAGMVPFKKVFLGMEEPADGKRRATTAQKCVRAGGKHNDLEQVGHTARHHTFFEMLGNFSFGDYFKRDAIRFAWDLLTSPTQLAIDPSLLRVSVHFSDDEAFALWQEIAGLPPERIYRLGDADNFWQMADTGPCGPCTEIYVDLAKVASDFRFAPHDAFVEGAESGRFLEIWNLVFMQFDKQPDGTLKPLPKPSVDTGAGLERIAAVKQKVTNNFHTDGFLSLIKTVEDTVGFSYWGRESDEHRTGVRIAGAKNEGVVQNAVDPASFRVVADHARSVAFLLADGVFPSNEGRGYVLRRILRRAVRHAYLLGRREPTLVHVVQTVIDEMGDVYPELKSRSEHLLQTTRVEEQAFLATIEGGLSRFEQLAPLHTTQGGDVIRGTISGEDAFRLYDTFGFPIDLTELMAHERGYTVDIAAFEAALLEQRTRSKDERKTRKLGVSADALGDIMNWDRPTKSVVPSEERNLLFESRFVGYDTIEIESEVVALRHLDGDRVAVLLRESPFYAESGGQISDEGEIVGDGWRIDVDGVRKVEGRSAALGKLSGEFHWGRATARVPSNRRRDTERNHTATHLMHSALREVLGDSVHQAGSLVAPDRLRFDFTHHGPVKAEKLAEVEAIVNREIWRALPVTWTEMPYPDARAKGAMALFGEKYGDVVRVVDVPGVSMELCGGTHVRNTSEIGLFVILSETGVASGVRRIEALTGPGAFAQLRSREDALIRVAELVKSPVDTVEKRVQQLLDERRTLDKKLEEAMRGGGDDLAKLISAAQAIGGNGAQLVIGEVVVGDSKALQAMGDALREQLKSGVGLLAAKLEDGKGSLLVVVTDDLRALGVRADAIVRDVAAVAGGRGGGKPHMAQAGLPDASRIAEALAAAPALVSKAVTGA
jgi:alanyl-tRNA synthetase